MKIELLSPVSMDVSHSESDIRFCTAEDEKILSQGLVGLLAVLVSDSDSVSDSVVFGLYQKTSGVVSHNTSHRSLGFVRKSQL